MSTDTERLAQEAEAHRNRLDATLDQLRQKLSPGAIVDETTAYLRDGNGAQLARNFGRQVRDNPIALGLVGAGIAWLFMGSGVRRGARELRDRYDEWSDERGRDDDDHEVYVDDYAANYTADAYLTNTDEIPDDRGRRRNAAASDNGDSNDGQGRVGLRDSASGIASDVKDRLHSASEAVSDSASAAGDRLRHTADEARDAARRVGRATRGASRFISRESSRLGHKAQRSFMNTLQEEPLIVGAIAVAIGAAIGAAFPSTRAEDRAVGRVRDRLRDDAIDYGKDAASRAGHLAKEAYRAADRAAEKEGLKPDGEKTLAERASSVATSAIDAAKDDARKQDLG
ncbi:MAG: DUF3618 domain-containing protein [Reyranellaceae bacterium]